MAIISSQNISEVGIASPTRTSASSEGDTFENSGSEFIQIENAGSGTTVLSVTTQVTSFNSPTYGPAVKQTRTLSVGAGITAVIGPFSPAAFNDATGYTAISYSVTTSVTVAIFTLSTN